MVVLRKRSEKTLISTLHLAVSTDHDAERIYHWRNKSVSWRHIRWSIGRRERWHSTSESRYSWSKTWSVNLRPSLKSFVLRRTKWRRRKNNKQLFQTPSDLFYRRANKLRALRESAIESKRTKVRKCHKWAWSWLVKLSNENSISASWKQKSCFHRLTQR